MENKTYVEKLKDPRWQKKRLEVLNRDNFTYQRCRDATNTLHVHHKAYHGDPWETPLDLLVTLCCDCHYAESEDVKEYSKILIETILSKGFLADALLTLASAFNRIELQDNPRKIIRVYEWALIDPNIQSELIKSFDGKLQQQRNGETING